MSRLRRTSRLCLIAPPTRRRCPHQTAVGSALAQAARFARKATVSYPAHAGHLLVIAFVIYLGVAGIAALLARVFAIGALLAFIVEIIAAFLLQAALVKAVQDVRDGRADLSIGVATGWYAARAGMCLSR